MSDYISEKIEQYERKLKQAEKAGKHNKAKKYAEKLERLRAEAAEQSTDSDTDSDDDDVDSDDEADNSFALDEEPDVAPRGLKGASKLEWLGGRGAKKLVANACREAVSDLASRAASEGGGGARFRAPTSRNARRVPARPRIARRDSRLRTRRRRRQPAPTRPAARGRDAHAKLIERPVAGTRV